MIEILKHIEPKRISQKSILNFKKQFSKKKNIKLLTTYSTLIFAVTKFLYNEKID